MRKFNDKSSFSGSLIREYRLKNHMSAEKLAQKLQLMGVNDKIRMYKKWNLKMYKICTK